MKTQLHWTLAALAALGGVANADDEGSTAGESLSVTGSSASRRGVAQDYLVLPSGGELTGQMKFITAQPSSQFGEDKLRFSDLAVFGLAGRWSLVSKLELSAHVELLPKQPSHTDEKPWQSVGVGLRSPLGRRVAVALSGSGGHLIGHTGMWTHESLAIQWRKPIARVLTFDVAAGVDGVSISAPKATSAFIAELAVATTALFREPSGHWGAWLGIGYAVPVVNNGRDPITNMTLDPQPRLDFRVGTVLSLVREWDLFAEFAVVDRGDASDPRTQLPILDGGFDQHQVIFGVTRHIDGKRRSHDDDDDDDDDLRLGMR